MDNPNYMTATMECWATTELHIKALVEHGYRSINPIKRMTENWKEYPYDNLILWINHKTKRYYTKLI